MDLLIAHDQTVDALRGALRNGKHSLANVPGLLKRVLSEDAWRRRQLRTGQEVAFDSFEAFVREPPLEGLGATVPLIKAIVRDDPEALDLLDRAMVGPAHVHRADADIVSVTDPSPDGNSRQGALRRLRKDRPDLHELVLAGELTAHAAAVQAGFRQRTITVPLDPERAAAALRRHFRAEQFDALMMALEKPNAKTRAAMAELISRALGDAT